MLRSERGMPWTPDEEKRVKKIEDRMDRLERNERDRDSALDRQTDQLKYEWKQAVDAVKHVFEDQVNALRPQLEAIEARGAQTVAINRAQNDVILEMSDEMKEAKVERVARRAREEAEAALKAENDRRAALAKEAETKLLDSIKADREHRLKVLAAITALIVAIGGIIAIFAQHH